MRWQNLIFFLSFVGCSGLSAQDTQLTLEPFQSPTYTVPRLFIEPDRILEFQLVADFEMLFRDGFSDSVEGQILLKENDESKAIKVSLRQRGYRRRQENKIKPLEIDILEGDNDDVSTAYFPTNRSFDLVPSSARYITYSVVPSAAEEIEQELLKEYYYYRLSNLLNDPSLLVRLVRIQYVNSDQTIRESGYGIIRESKKAMAKRLGLVKIDRESSVLNFILPQQYSLNWYRVVLFEYLIRNFDFDFYILKNMVGLRTSKNHIVYVPYDFDFAHSIRPTFENRDLDVNLKDKILNSMDMLMIEFQKQGVAQREVYSNVLNTLKTQFTRLPLARNLVKNLYLNSKSREVLTNELNVYERSLAAAIREISRSPLLAQP